MRHELVKLIGIGLVTVSIATAQAQTQPDYGHASALAIMAGTRAATLHLSSAAFSNDSDIPRDNTLYGANRLPALTWTRGPRATKTYLVVVQGGPGEPAGQTSIHLTLFNIPASTTSLAEGAAGMPAGARFGPNVHGLDQPYSGPHTHTPKRQPYHFQVLALDTRLPDRVGMTYDAIIGAARGHVLAKADLVGWSAQPADAATPAPPTPAPPTPAPPRIDPTVSASLISRADALTLVRRSIEACEVRGEKAAASVTDADGNLRAALTADGMNTIGIRSVGRKTATVLKFRVPTRALRERAAADAAFAAEFGKDERYYFSPGGLPIYRNGTFVAVLAVGGGHALDEDCALDALRDVPWARTTPN